MQKVLEHTRFGDVIEAKDGNACVYINGTKIAEEKRFMFSYNIYPVADGMSWERDTYIQKAIDILCKCKSDAVITSLTNELMNFDHEELQWGDTRLLAITHLRNLFPNCVFITQYELNNNFDIPKEMVEAGYNVLFIPNSLCKKLNNINEKNTNVFFTLKQYRSERKLHFNNVSVDKENLSGPEQDVYNRTGQILDFGNILPEEVNTVLITNEIYNCFLKKQNSRIKSLYMPEGRQIWIKRSQLRSFSDYSGELLYSCARAISDNSGISMESAIKKIMGELCSKLVQYF